MSIQIGPISRSRLVLCSADASPHSQRPVQARAEVFFPGGKWVGAVRNASKLIGCRFAILTTEYGLVNPDDVLEPYDKHIDQFMSYVTEKWQETVPRNLGRNSYDFMLFYAGGCPRDPYLEILRPILRTMGISVVSFGKPNMYDAGKTRRIAEMLIEGTTLEQMRAVLKCPERLLYFPAR